MKMLWLLALALTVSIAGASATTVFNDTFNRANGALGQADSGQNWTGGGWGIVTNAAQSSNDTSAQVNFVMLNTTSAEEVNITFEIGATAVGTDKEVYFRNSTGSTVAFGIRLLTASNSVQLRSSNSTNIFSGVVLGNTFNVSFYNINFTSRTFTAHVVRNGSGSGLLSNYSFGNGAPVAVNGIDQIFLVGVGTTGTARLDNMYIQSNNPADRNLTISAYDAYNGTSINVFNATVTWNGTTTLYTTTTGSITTNATDVNATLPANITIVSSQYFTNTTLSHSSEGLSSGLVPYTAIRGLYILGGGATIFSINYTNNANVSESGIVSTTTGIAYAPLFNSTYTVTLYDASNATSSFAMASANITANPYNQSYNFTLYLTNSVNIVIRDEITGNRINTTTAYIYFSGTIFSYNYSTTSGSINASLLNPEEYIITYYAAGYSQRLYWFTVTNQSTNNLDLYLRPTTATTTVLISVTDQSLNKLQNTFVQVYVKNITGTNDYLVEMCKTDSNGQCLISADVSTTTYVSNFTYRFFLNFNDLVIGDSGYTKLSSNTLTLQSDVNTNPLQPYFNIPSIIFTPISYTNNIFSVTFGDNGNNQRYFCLYTERRTGGTTTITGSNCTTTAGSSLTLFANSSIGDETRAYLTVVVEGAGDEPYLLVQASALNNAAGGQFSAYLIFFIAIGLGSAMFFGMGYYPQGALIAIVGVFAVLFEIGGFVTRAIIVGLGIIVAVIVVIMGKRE